MAVGTPVQRVAPDGTLYTETGQTTTTVITPGSNIASGTLLVLLATANANKSIASVTDSTGANTWVVDVTGGDGTRRLSVASCQVATGITTGGSITVTWSPTTSGTVAIWAYEVSSAATSSAFDKSASGSGTGTALTSGNTATLSMADEAVFGVFRSTASAPTWTKGASYSESAHPHTTTNLGSDVEYKVVAATTAVAADASTSSSGTWVALAATYKGLSGGGASLSLSDTAFTFSEAFVRQAVRLIADTAATFTESLHVTALSLHLTDTGVSFSETLGRSQRRTLADTGVTQTVSFPSTGVLETFNRADGALGAAWDDPQFGDSFAPTISGNKAIGNAGGWAGAIWQNTSTTFGPYTEIYADVAAVLTGNRIGLFLRGSGTGATNNSYELTVDASTWTLTEIASGNPTQATPTATQAISIGDGIGLSASGPVLTAWYRPGAGSWTAIQSWIDATYAGTGWIGFELESSVVGIDNFGGGTAVPALDSLVAQKVTGVRALTDTGATFSESLVRKSARLLTDTGATVSESLARALSCSLTDTGTTVSETLARKAARFLTDTGAAVTESLARTVLRALTDTGATFSESLVRGPARALTDTGVAFTDSLHVTRLSLHISDTGATVTDALVSRRNRPLADSGIVGVTNLTTNGGFETNLTGYIVYGGGVVTPTRDTSDQAFGAVSMKVDCDGGTVQQGMGSSFLTVLPSTTYTFAVSVKAPNGTVMNLRSLQHDGGGGTSADVTNSFTADGTWQRKTFSFTTAASTATVSVGTMKNQAGAVIYWMDGLQLELGSAASDYIDTDGAARTAFAASLARAVLRAQTDTGTSFSETLVKGPRRLLTDTGTTFSETLLRKPTRLLATTGVSFSESVAVGAAIAISDTGITQSDSLAAQRFLHLALTDTGVSQTDSLLLRRSRSNTDTGVNFSESLARVSTRSLSLTDIGLTQTDSLLENPVRQLTDTGLTQTDALLRITASGRSLSDTGATVTETLARRAARFLSDTGATVSDSLARGATVRALTDTGTTFTETLVKRVARLVTDTGATVTDAVAAARRLALTDSAITSGGWGSEWGMGWGGAGDTLVAVFAAGVTSTSRTLTDTGATVSTAVASTRARLPVDTGATVTDAVATVRVRRPVDTGVTQTDFLHVSALSLHLTDTGVTVTDSLAERFSRPFTDTGVSFSESLARAVSRFSLADIGAAVTATLVRRPTRLLATVGTTVSDFISTTPQVGLADLGVFFSETLARTARYLRVLTDTAATVTEQLLAVRNRLFAETGVSFAETLRVSRPFPLTDTGVTQTDSLAGRRVRHFLADQGVTASDSLTRGAATLRTLTDTALTFTDAVARKPQIPLIDAAFSTGWGTGWGTSWGLRAADSLASNPARTFADTGVVFSESLKATAAKAIGDTGTSLSESLAPLVSRLIADTGTSFSEALQATTFRLVTFSIADQGVTHTDTLALNRFLTLTLTDQGVTHSDTLALNRFLTLTLTDQGVAQTDSLTGAFQSGSLILVDTGSSIVTLLARRVERPLETDGVSFADSLHLIGEEPYVFPTGPAGFIARPHRGGLRRAHRGHIARPRVGSLT